MPGTLRIGEEVRAASAGRAPVVRETGASPAVVAVPGGDLAAAVSVSRAAAIAAGGRA